MPSKTTFANSVAIIARVFAAGLFLWLAIIAPLASMLALTSGDAFYSLLDQSLFFLPWPLLLLLGVFRTKNKTFRWWVFQYLGVSAVCFSGALISILLSLFLPFGLSGQIGFSLCVLLCAWGIYSAHRIHVEKVKITSPKISQAVRLVQISDVHIG
jgi:hypothetical protein